MIFLAVENPSSVYEARQLKFNSSDSQNANFLAKAGIYFVVILIKFNDPLPPEYNFISEFLFFVITRKTKRKKKLPEYLNYARRKKEKATDIR